MGRVGIVERLVREDGEVGITDLGEFINRVSPDGILGKFFNLFLIQRRTTTYVVLV